MSEKQNDNCANERESDPREVSEVAMRNRRTPAGVESSNSEEVDEKKSPPADVVHPVDPARKARPKKYYAYASPDDFPYGQYDSPLTDEEDIRQGALMRGAGRRFQGRRFVSQRGGGRGFRSGWNSSSFRENDFGTNERRRQSFRRASFRGRFTDNNVDRESRWRFNQNNNGHEERITSTSGDFRAHRTAAYGEEAAYDSRNMDDSGQSSRRVNVNRQRNECRAMSTTASVVEKTWYNRSYCRGFATNTAKSGGRRHGSSNFFDGLTVERSASVKQVPPVGCSEVVGRRNTPSSRTSQNSLTTDGSFENVPITPNTMIGSLSQELCQLCQINVAEKGFCLVKKVAKQTKPKEAANKEVQTGGTVEFRDAITQTAMVDGRDAANMTYGGQQPEQQGQVAVPDVHYANGVQRGSQQYVPLEFGQQGGTMRFSPQLIAANLPTVVQQGQPLSFVDGNYVPQAQYDVGSDQYFFVAPSMPTVANFDPRFYNVIPGAQFPGR